MFVVDGVDSDRCAEAVGGDETAASIQYLCVVSLSNLLVEKRLKGGLGALITTCLWKKKETFNRSTGKVFDSIWQIRQRLQLQIH